MPNEQYEKKMSIIVPCYKVEKFLPRCLDSLINQTLDGVEIICINDGSPDRCIDILKQYVARYPDTIVVIDKQNEGVWRGRFDGIRIARGEYIGFLDSDDWAEPCFAETLYNAAKAVNAEIAVGGFRRIDLVSGKETSIEMDGIRPSFIVNDDPGRLLELNGAPWNKIFHSSILKGMHDLEKPPAVLDDMIFHQLAFLETHGMVVFAGGILVNYVIRAGSITTSLTQQQADTTYDAFIKVKELYENNGASYDRLNALDAMAFLHLGAVLMFRLSADPNCDFDEAYRRNREYLDMHFSSWRYSPYINLRYALKYRGAFLKLLFFQRVYKMGMLPAFMRIYTFMIEKMHIDIKW